MLPNLPTLPPLVQALGFPSLLPALLSVSPPFGHLSEAAFPAQFPPTVGSRSARTDLYPGGRPTVVWGLHSLSSTLIPCPSRACSLGDI